MDTEKGKMKRTPTVAGVGYPRANDEARVNEKESIDVVVFCWKMGKKGEAVQVTFAYRPSLRFSVAGRELAVKIDT